MAFMLLNIQNNKKYDVSWKLCIYEHVHSFFIELLLSPWNEMLLFRTAVEGKIAVKLLLFQEKSPASRDKAQ